MKTFQTEIKKNKNRKFSENELLKQFLIFINLNQNLPFSITLNEISKNLTIADIMKNHSCNFQNLITQVNYENYKKHENNEICEKKQ